MPGTNTVPKVVIKQIPLTNTVGTELFTTYKDREPVFHITKTGILWGSASGCLFKIVPAKTGGDKIINEDMSLYGITKETSGDYRTIIKIAEDTINELLCLKGEDFFSMISEKTGGVSHWKCASFDLNMGRNQVIFNDGMLWERTAKGLFCFNLLQKRMFHIISNNAQDNRVLQNPFSIYKDRSGIIWIGTTGYGLLKYNSRTQVFHNVPGSSTRNMSATPTGNVLILGDSLKLYTKDSSIVPAEYKEESTFRNTILHYTREQPGMAMQDKEGTYWLEKDGLIRANMKKKEVFFLKKSGDVIFPFFLDKTDRFWYADSHSLYWFNKITNRSISYKFPVSTPTNLYRFCQVIYQDIKGILWLGTTDGLFSFNEKTKQWRHYKNNPGNIASLSNNIVFTICEDPTFPGEYIWIGTNGGGLNRLSVNTGKFDRVDTKDGLPNMVVYGILADEDKQLWMSTNKGIACLKVKYDYTSKQDAGKLLQKSFRYYYEENGLQSNEFNRYAYCKTKDGTMFFGGVNGFNYFNPQSVTINSRIPNVIITDLKIGNKPVSFVADNSKAVKDHQQILRKPVFLTDAIDLPYTANMVSFDFTSLDFTSPENNLYQYKLEGFDEEWIKSGNIHSATYTNLDPGTYTFRVKGSNSDGVWNEQGTAVKLTVLTPWFKSWWFKIALFSACIGWSVLFFRYRLQQKIKLYDLRNHIARDLHDEIGSTLSSVHIYSEVAQNTTPDKNSRTSSYLKLISADAGNMIEALNDIVWAVNAKNDRFENIINRMRASAIEVFEAKGYELHLRFDEQLNASRLGMEKRKNFYLLYKEAVNNAAKYANGKNVWITLNFRKSLLYLSVKDDGKGFVFNKRAPGNGISNMQKRASLLKGKLDIISSPENGTAIQLVFPI